jgi:hypothetical protein
MFEFSPSHDMVNENGACVHCCIMKLAYDLSDTFIPKKLENIPSDLLQPSPHVQPPII